MREQIGYCWEKAAECARAIQISLDPHRKAVLSNLQQMWMVLADERRFLTPQELAREVEAIGRLHAGLDDADEPAARHSKLQLY